MAYAPTKPYSSGVPSVQQLGLPRWMSEKPDSGHMQQVKEQQALQQLQEKKELEAFIASLALEEGEQGPELGYDDIMGRTGKFLLSQGDIEGALKIDKIQKDDQRKEFNELYNMATMTSNIAKTNPEAAKNIASYKPQLEGIDYDAIYKASNEVTMRVPHEGSDLVKYNKSTGATTPLIKGKPKTRTSSDPYSKPYTGEKMYDVLTGEFVYPANKGEEAAFKKKGHITETQLARQFTRVTPEQIEYAKQAKEKEAKEYPGAKAPTQKQYSISQLKGRGYSDKDIEALRKQGRVK